ncbi:hypothetical protein D9M70_458280 [compost metagenome]
MEEGAPARVAVDDRRLFQFDRQVLEIALHHPGGERQVEGRVGDDQRRLRVQHVEVVEEQVERDDADDRRHHPRRQYPEGNLLAPLPGIAEARQRITRHRTKNHGNDGRAGRDEEAVQRVTQERSPNEGFVIVLQCRVARQPFGRHGEDIDVELERVRGDPIDRKKREHQGDEDRQIGGQADEPFSGAAACGEGRRRHHRQSASRMRFMNQVLRTIVTNSTNSDIAAA